MTSHRLDPVSLVFGLVFVAIGIPFLFDRIDLFSVNWSWLMPLLLLVVGGLLLSSVLRQRPNPADEIPEAPSAAAPEPEIPNVQDPDAL